MGQANKRGTFDERKADAIAAGRIKTRKRKPRMDMPTLDGVSALMVTSGNGNLSKIAMTMSALWMIK